MPDDALQKASLAYRKAQEAITRGDVPAKYTRLLPFIRGRHILEIGAAEGVLSLLLAREQDCESITALERRADRHDAGRLLRAHWFSLGFDVTRCRMIQGDIREHLHLLEGSDTLVAVRTIYYLRDDAPRVMAEAAKSVTRVVLCGNKGRQRQAREDPKSELGRFNFLASVEGMTWLLTRAGYLVTAVHDEGDPIVVGERR